MSIEEAFKKQNFLDYADGKYTLDDKDTIFIKKRLEESGVLSIIPLLKVIKTLPDELLEPIIMSGLDYEDASEPRVYMHSINRIYRPENIQEILFEFIQGENLKLKCKALHFLYFVYLPILRVRDSYPTQWKLNEYVWNGQMYAETQNTKVDQEELRKRFKDFRLSRLYILLDQFESCDNIIIRYYITLLMNPIVDVLNDLQTQFSKSTRDRLDKIIPIIKSDHFPKDAISLTKIVKGNTTLEKLLFEDLNWSGNL